MLYINNIYRIKKDANQRKKRKTKKMKRFNILSKAIPHSNKIEIAENKKEKKEKTNYVINKLKSI